MNYLVKKIKSEAHMISGCPSTYHNINTNSSFESSSVSSNVGETDRPENNIAKVFFIVASKNCDGIHEINGVQI